MHTSVACWRRPQEAVKAQTSVALADFEEAGFLPEAMANYLALLGWGPTDDIEVRPLSEITELFDLADVNKAPAFFDIKKLEHINGEYVRMLSVPEFIDATAPFIVDVPWQADRFSAEAFAAVAPYAQERTRRLGDVVEVVDWIVHPRCARRDR